jgi:predicted CopG family antitoxin
MDVHFVEVISAVIKDGTRSIKTIAVDFETYTRLREYGRPPDSFNKIVRRLLDECEQKISAVEETVISK